MRLKIVVAALLTLLLVQDRALADNNQAPSKPKDAVFHVSVTTRIVESNGAITIRRGHGSAFAIRYKEKWAIVTAMHVVKASPENEATVYSTNYPTRLALKFSSMDKGDIAYAEIDKMPDGWAWIEVGALPEKDQVCGSWGFPGNGALEGRSGVVRHLASAEEIALRKSMPQNSRYANIRGLIAEGMSGGPVVTKDGKVFGMVSHKIVTLDKQGREISDPDPIEYAALLPEPSASSAEAGH